MRGVLESVQPELEPDHAHAQAYRLQAVLVRPLRAGLPAEGGSATAPRLAARRRAARRRAAAAPLPLLTQRAARAAGAARLQLRE